MIDIQENEKRVAELEQMIEESVNKEEYDEAEEYQNEIDNIQKENLEKLREELKDATDDIGNILSQDDEF